MHTSLWSRIGCIAEERLGQQKRGEKLPLLSSAEGFDHNGSFVFIMIYSQWVSTAVKWNIRSIKIESILMKNLYTVHIHKEKC